MTAMRYPCRSVKIRLYTKISVNWKIKSVYFTNLSNVDFPAPRNPQIMVRGTREGDSGMISVASVSILVESVAGRGVDAADAYGGSSSES